MKTMEAETEVSRERLIEFLNQDLAREYQAVITYDVYSQIIKGAAFMNIGAELEKHAQEELVHALIVAEQIDYLGGMPTVIPRPVKTLEDAQELLQLDLENETATIHSYHERVRQCEALGEFAMAERIRDILVDEQGHQIDLLMALGRNGVHSI
jgi:bacterioferritin